MDTCLMPVKQESILQGSDVYGQMIDAAIYRVNLSIRFKEYLLSRDISSRRVILETAIGYMEKSGDARKQPVLAWLRNLLNINGLPDSAERKEQIRFDACWDELHLELNKSAALYTVMYSFVS